MQRSSPLPRTPKADSFSVSEIVYEARRGRLRVPRFQRPLRWENEDVRKLFDSILLGYPVGSLLLWRRPKTLGGPIALGPVHIPIPDDDNVLWIVDGQQRITALTAALTAKRDPDPRFDVWFDPERHSFETVSSRQRPPLHWVPVHQLLDAADLGEFLLEWAPGLQRKEWRRTLLEVGKRIREFQLPAYILETSNDDISVLREVFRRINRQGKGLSEAEVFNALDETVEGDLSGLEIAARDVRSLGWGEVDENTLLFAALTNEGLDPTKRIGKQRSGAEEKMAGAVRRMIPALLRTVGFLKEEAGIPHRRLLPHRTPLIVLPAYFARHPDADARSRTLLRRWVWRGFATGAHAPGQRVRLRGAARIAAGPLGAEEKAERLVRELVGARREPWRIESQASGNVRYDARSAHSRIGLLAMAHAAPRDIISGSRRSVSALFEEHDAHAVRKISTSDVPKRETIANRLLHGPVVGLHREIQKLARSWATHPELLESHAMDAIAAQALVTGDDAVLLQRRSLLIERLVESRVQAYAEWDADDSSSLRALFVNAS